MRRRPGAFPKGFIIFCLTAAAIYSGMPFSICKNILKDKQGGTVTMNLKAKRYTENQKKVTSEKLALRISFLKEKGVDVVAVKRDSLVKKLKGDIRKANYRLACIAAQEKLNADKVEAKAGKLAAQKNVSDKPKAKSAKGASAKKEKKDKKKAPAPASDSQS
jgi:hypothetical protein